MHLYSCSPQLNYQQKTNDGYVYVWGDEFNYSGKPDAKKWDYEVGFIRNNEPQWYQRENASVKNGHLTIEARKEKIINPNFQADSKDYRLNRQYAEYTSSCLITKAKFEFTYGRAIIRCKIDINQGQWPAFWMLGANMDQVSWPACGEVDIMEYYRGIMHANAAWQGDRETKWDDAKWKIADLGHSSWWNEFHEWQMDWDEQKIDIFLDGKLLNHVDLTKTVNVKNGDNPFQSPFYLLLNLALGQDGEIIPESSLPSKLMVDYIRVYQKPAVNLKK